MLQCFRNVARLHFVKAGCPLMLLSSTNRRLRAPELVETIPMLGKRKRENADVVEGWTVKIKDKELPQTFKNRLGIANIEQVLIQKRWVSDLVGEKNLWDNFGHREYIAIEFIKVAYNINDLQRCPGRSGPDLTTMRGKRANIEVKSTTFKRKSLTAAYCLGQFARQNTKEIREFALSLDSIIYATFSETACLPVFIIVLHSGEAMQQHKRLLKQKHTDFLAKTTSGPKGGRDTISICVGDLVSVLFIDDQPVDGFEAWLNGKQISNWTFFVDHIKCNKRIDLNKIKIK